MRVCKWIASSCCMILVLFSASLQANSYVDRFRQEVVRCANDNMDDYGNFITQLFEDCASHVKKSMPPKSREDYVGVASITDADRKELVSVEEIIKFLQNEPDKPLKNMLVSSIIDRFEKSGIFVKGDGLLYKDSESGGKSHCGSTKHSWNVDFSILLKKPSNLSLLYDALSEPIYISLYVDGEIGIDGKGSFRPSTKIIGKCVRYDKVSFNVDLPSLPVEMLVETVINLNPTLIKPNESSEGRYELVLDPKGKVKGTVRSFGDFDVNADVDAAGGVGAIVGSMFGAPLNGFLAELGIARFSEGKIEKKIKKTVVDKLSGYVAEPVVFNITNRLGGMKLYKLPGINDISSSLLYDIIEREGMSGPLCSELVQRRDEFVNNLLVYASFKEEESLQTAA